MSNRYQLIVFDGYSPYTKLPSTQFRQPTVGILRQPHCDTEYSGVRRPQQISKPQRMGEIIHPVVYCPQERPDILTVVVGEHFEPKGIELVGIQGSVQLEYDESLFEKISDKLMAATVHGGHTITLLYRYPFGAVCEQKLGVLAVDPSKNQCIFDVTDVYMKIGETLNYEDFIINPEIASEISEVIFKMDQTHVLERYGHLSLIARTLGDVEITVIFKHGLEEYEYNEKGDFRVTNLEDISYCVQRHVVHVVTAEKFAEMEALENDTV